MYGYVEREMFNWGAGSISTPTSIRTSPDQNVIGSTEILLMANQTPDSRKGPEQS